MTSKAPTGKKPRKKATTTASQTPTTIKVAPPTPAIVAAESTSGESTPTEPPPQRVEKTLRVDCAGFGSGNLAALLESNAEWTEGLALMGQTMLGITRESMQGAAETSLALIDSRSLPSAWALGMQLARDQVDRLLRGSAELTEIGWRTATATCEPLLDLARARLDRG